jgi:flagellar hook-associated protein 3 FlgL
MVRGLDPISERFLKELNETNRRMERAQHEISSGKRLTVPSDNPDQVSTLLEARVHLEVTTQIRMNLGRFQAEVDSGESAIQAAVRLIERAQVLGAQGLNGTQTAETRAGIAEEVMSLLEQVISISGTTVEGRFIFAGDDDSTLPYSLDPLLVPPISGTGGTLPTRKAQHPNGTLFAVSRSAAQIFDDPDPAKNVFGALWNLYTGLTQNDVTIIEAAEADLRSAGSHLNEQLAFYGSVQARVRDATDAAHQMELRAKTTVSLIEDADITASILELNQMRLQQEAALKSRAMAPQSSLFDYLG